MTEGVALINDMTESQLLSLVKEKSWPALAFWLKHRNPNFKEKVEVIARIERDDQLTPEQEQVVREALNLARGGSKKIDNLNSKNYERTENDSTRVSG
jgi:hypothetical protein